jgi:hypothetical protein
MSSHREAPEISQDPTADNTDTYAFVSPDRPDTVTILTNYVPIEAAAGGPNFYEFGEDVQYSIYISNKGTAEPDITYTFRFETTVLNKRTFLYNLGAITSLDDPNFNRRQSYSVTKQIGTGTPKLLATGLRSPPCNIGPHSTPNYTKLAQAAIHQLPGQEVVFAGQRNDGFYADLGAIFDLADLRPFQTLHVAPMAPSIGLDALKNGINVHTIALQIPIRSLTRDGSVPKDVGAAAATIGVWGAASRRKMRVRGDTTGQHTESGPWVQVSRLGNPLFNELMVPMVKKDGWNGSQPKNDAEYAEGIEQPELPRLLPDLYPNEFESLRKLASTRTVRKDLVAFLLNGFKPGIFAGFQNYTGPIKADMLRLNVAVPPAKAPQALGGLADDPAGYPNGRRVQDDIITVFVKMLAAVIYDRYDPSFKPDLATGIVTQGVPTPPTGDPDSSSRFINRFPYLGEPHNGFDNPSVTSGAGPLPDVAIPGVTP